MANTLAWATGDLRDRCRRRGRHHRDGAPLQHRAVAAADRAQGRDPALVRAHRRRSARPVEHRRPHHRAHQGRLADLGLQHARHHQPGRRDRAPAPTRSARSSCVDASQAAPQLPVDVVGVGADLLAFTGHKVVGPTGIGVLWGRREVLDSAAAVPRWRRDDRDGDDGSVRRTPPIPHKFEAGTPPIIEAIGLGAAVDYLGHIGLDAIHAHEQAITGYALDGLASVPGVRVLGPLDAASRGGAISFELDGVHPHDIAPGARLARRRGARRTPLRQAGARALRRAGLDADVVLPLHDARPRSTP